MQILSRIARPRKSVLLTFLLALSFHGAGAQSPVSSFEILVSEETLGPGERVVVTHTAAGVPREDRGDVLDLSEDRIVLQIDERQLELSEFEVRTIVREGDSIWDGTGNGALIGGGIGALVYALTAATACSNEGSPCPKVALGLVGIGASLGALAGLAVDANSKDRQTLYQAPTATRAFVIAPFHAPGRTGVFVGLRF